MTDLIAVSAPTAVRSNKGCLFRRYDRVPVVPAHPSPGPETSHEALKCRHPLL